MHIVDKEMAIASRMEVIYKATKRQHEDSEDNLILSKRLKKIHNGENLDPTGEDFDDAALIGNMEMMISLKEMGCPFGIETLYNAMKHAVKEKTIHNLVWLKNNNIWNEDNFDLGNFWEWGNYCTYDEFYGLEYLKEAGYELDNYITEGLLCNCAWDNDFKKVKWCIENGLRFENSLHLGSCSDEMIVFLISNGCPFPLELVFEEYDENKTIKKLTLMKEKGCNFIAPSGKFGKYKCDIRFLQDKVKDWLEENGMLDGSTWLI